MDVKKQKGSEVPDIKLERQSQKVSVKKIRLREWIEEIKQEIKTIQWTSPGELRTYTKVVVGATFFFGMGVYFVDYIIHGALSFLTWMSRLLV